MEDSRYWGAQTQRSIKNFPIGGPESKMPLEVIKGAFNMQCDAMLSQKLLECIRMGQSAFCSSLHSCVSHVSAISERGAVSMWKIEVCHTL